jgi:hypothetical protein
MRCLAKRLPAFLVFFLLLGAAESRAQVMRIRGGAIAHTGNQVLSPYTSHSFYLIGDGITAAGGDEKGASVAMSCNPCAPGETLRMSVTINRFYNVAHGMAIIDGRNHYPVWFLGSEIKLAITPVTIPDSDITNGVATRFTLSGNLLGYPFPSPIPLFNRELAGQGVVRLGFVKSSFPDRPGYMFQRAQYKFDTPRTRPGRKEAASPSRPATLEQQ